ncbi:MAG TPA: rRNA maturation RNase YbeY, partial [Thermoleophilia bacterium]|nr:rRNA maturation RNase YbeY [Thermoleophilia bacterium]
MTSAVEVVNHTRAAIDEEAVAALVEAVLEAEGAGGAEVGVTFVGERRMRALNREYRGKDEVTDVLSFPLEDVGESGQRAPEGREGRAGGAAGPAAGDAPPRLLG